MPLNLEDIKNTQESNLAKLLQNRRSAIPGNVNAFQSQIEGGRDLASPVNAAIGNVGLPNVLGADVNQFQTGRLARALSPKLALSKLNAGRTALGLQGENINRRREDARNALLNTQGDITQAQNLTRGENFIADQNALDRASQLNQQDILDSYAQQSNNMLDQYYNTGPDYSSALARALSGLGAGITTGLVLGRSGKVNLDIPSPSISFLQAGPLNNLGYYPQLPDIHQGLPKFYGE